MAKKPEILKASVFDYLDLLSDLGASERSIECDAVFLFMLQTFHHYDHRKVDETGWLTTTYNELAHKSHMSKKKVERCLHRLRGYGLIETERGALKNNPEMIGTRIILTPKITDKLWGKKMKHYRLKEGVPLTGYDNPSSGTPNPL